MTKQHQGPPVTSGSSEEADDQGLDPRDTNHPTGTQQADENAREESPS
ncbi:MAG: hypothetical protein JWR11_3378 [Mycobacterium sp.]|jgi:hypothetical protein|nr:hypothetical protein [Mycobacterium sp.]MDT5069786.1 hypothetical protein [Mycobacterium sp.]MDT5177231.1 hypothetical protein [Mycobacterium sp.]